MKVLKFPLSLEVFNAALNADYESPEETARRDMNAGIGIAEDALAELIGDLAKRPALDDEQKRRISLLLTQAQVCASYANLTHDNHPTEQADVRS